MQFDMFGETPDPQPSQATPPALATNGAWASPHTIALNAAFKRRALTDVIALLRGLTFEELQQTLLGTGFALQHAKNRKELMGFIGPKLVAATNAGLNGYELREPGNVVTDQEIKPEAKSELIIMRGDMVHFNGHDYTAIGPLTGILTRSSDDNSSRYTFSDQTWGFERELSKNPAIATTNLLARRPVGWPIEDIEKRVDAKLITDMASSETANYLANLDAGDYAMGFGGPALNGIVIQRQLQTAQGQSDIEVAYLIGDDAIQARLAFQKNVLNMVRVTPDVAANMMPGTRVIDSAGREFQAHSARRDYLEAFPIGVNGQPEIFAGNAVVFHLNAATAWAYPNRRHDTVVVKRGQELAKPQEIADTSVIENGVNSPLTEFKELQNGQSSSQPGNIRGGPDLEDRANGTDRGSDSEPMDAGLAGSGNPASGDGVVPGRPGETNGVGEGHPRGIGASESPVGVGDSSTQRSGGASPNDAGRRFAGGVDGLSSLPDTGAAATPVPTSRAELSRMFVTDMTDQQLLEAQAIWVDGSRSRAIQRQIAQRQAGGNPVAVPTPQPVAVSTPQPKDPINDVARTLRVGDMVSFADHIGGVFHPGDVATVRMVNRNATQFTTKSGGAPWISNSRLNHYSLGWSKVSGEVSQAIQPSAPQAVVVDENSSEVDKIAARYAQVLADGRPGVSPEVTNFHRRFAQAIVAKEALALKWITNGMNAKGKAMFSSVTGVKLPRGQAASWEVIKIWGGLMIDPKAITQPVPSAPVASLDSGPLDAKPDDQNARALPPQSAGTPQGVPDASAPVPAESLTTDDQPVSSEITPEILASLADNAYLPVGWKESPSGRMATNIDPRDGGIIDQPIVSDEWFAVSNNSDIGTLTGFSSRKAAFDGLAAAVSKANSIAEPSPVDTPTVDTPGITPAPDAPTNFVISDDDQIGVGSLLEKFNDNIKAILLVSTLKTEQRTATADEKKQLARYVGWGGLKGVFDPQNKQWASQHKLLKGLLTDAQWAAASRSQLNAHFTASLVVKAMYEGIGRLGFNGGRVLEPSVGVGNFFGLMPEGMSKNSELHGVELDILTSEIVSALYPEAKIAQATGFQAYNVPAGYFDMAVGNPPFGSESVVDDRGSAYSGWSIHNYFFAKSIEMLRPGGIMPMVVSHNFLDKLDPHVRQWIGRRAELVSGVRLPNTAFKENANTEVVTDVLIFRRLDNENTLGEAATPDWLKTTDVTLENHQTGEFSTVAVNNYFLNNPQNVLGTNSLAGSMYKANEYTVLPNGDLGEQLSQWVATLPEGIYTPIKREATQDKAVKIDIPDHVKEGSYFLHLNEIYLRGNDSFGETRADKWEAPNNRAIERMRGMIEIRDSLRKQIALEKSSTSSVIEIESNRRGLNEIYDQFQKKFGFVNDQANRRLFCDDTESALVQALEFDYEKPITAAKAEEYGVEQRPARCVKADIMSRRVLFPAQEIEVVETAKDALLHSLNHSGHVDMAYMEKAYGKDAKSIETELGDLLFNDPVHGLVTADEYLSGDVKTKLDEVSKAARINPALARNEAALRSIIPIDKLPSEIHAAIGAAWIPTPVYAQFAKEISGGSVDFTYLKATAQWFASSVGSPNFALNSTEFGTAKMSAQTILKTMMNSRGLEVKKTIMVDGAERSVTDEEATEGVRQKGEKIRTHWDSWLWQDNARTETLVKIYNDKFNRVVERAYDGSHLTLPGMNPSMSLLKHQKNGVWRGLQDRVMLLDQVVGAGKTFEKVALAMEMRRLGIAKKPLIGVPNHLTLQWRSEFYRLYPGANVLAATPQDFEKDNRERFFSKIVTGNWDAVIVGHSSLKKIQIPPEAEAAILNEQIDDIAKGIKSIKESRGDRNIIRDMEKIKANLEAKIAKLLLKSGTKDKVVDFSDLGVDALFIDEMHEFKNLQFSTQMNRVAGLGNPAGSGKAFDLFCKVRYMQDVYGDKAPLITATGTPVSNSLAEMFTVQRFMQYNQLRKNGLHVFDAWARQYGDVQNVYEVAPSGSGYRLSQRFAKFKNLPSLMGAYRSFADVITLDDLKNQEKAQGKKFPVPKLFGGRPENIVAKRSPLQEAYFGVPEILRHEDSGEIEFGYSLDNPFSFKQREDGKVVRLTEKDDYTETSQPYNSLEEARYMTAVEATTPQMTIDPKSIVGQFERLAQITRETKGKVNALSLTGLANKAGLDYRLINPSAPDYPDSKINVAVRDLLVTAKKWEADKGTQLVFCDLSVPLSAKAKMASKEKRIYVRELDGALTHKKGTLHIVKDFDQFSYYLVASGKGNAKLFSMYDPATGSLIKSGIDSKADAHDFASNFLNKPNGPERWNEQIGRSREISEDEIDEYKNELSLDVDGDSADVEITRQDLEGATGPIGFSVYDDMKAKLIAGGMPAHQIEFIHDHDTPQSKDLLFKRVNAGDVRILFGSTPKMGAGTNVQQRLVGLSHIDAPWRPSDLEQREGRIIRRGNKLYERDPEGFEIRVRRYATEQTYDTRRWQLLEHKASGIEQLRKYSGENEIEDVASEAANSADMKAAASGNPLILKETQLATTVKKLTFLQKAYQDNEYVLNRRIKENNSYATIEGPKIVNMLSSLRDKAGNSAVLGEYKGTALADKEAVMEALEDIAANVKALGTPVKLTYKGLDFKFAIEQITRYVKFTLPDGENRLIGELSKTGMVTRMDNFIGSLPGEIEKYGKWINKSVSENADLVLKLGQPFPEKDALDQARNEHGNVVQALKKMSSLSAVKPHERAEFDAVLEQRKASLRALGLGDVVDQIEKESAIDVSVLIQADVVAPSVAAVPDVAAAPDSPVLQSVVDLSDSELEKRIMVAADTVAELRKVDVYRVLVESNRAEYREALADFIKRHRPDLVVEVDDVLAEVVAHGTAATEPDGTVMVESPAPLVSVEADNAPVLAEQSASHPVFGRTFSVVADFADSEEGYEQANRLITTNQGSGVLDVVDGRVILASLSDKGIVLPVLSKGAGEGAVPVTPEYVYPFGRTDQEDRFHGSRVRVSPELAGDVAWDGTVMLALNGGRLLSVVRDSGEADRLSVRIAGDRIQVLKTVDKLASVVEARPPEPEVKRLATEAFGQNIYPIIHKGEPKWACQIPENAGTGKVLGDTIHATFEDAVAEAELISKKEADKAARMVVVNSVNESNDSVSLAISERINHFAQVNDFPALEKGKAKAVLSVMCRDETGVESTRAEWVEKKISLGAKLSSETENKVKPMSRMAHFRADQREQDAHEKRVKEGGTKSVYFIGDFSVTKTEYLYAAHVLNQLEAGQGALEQNEQSGVLNSRDDAMDVLQIVALKTRIVEALDFDIPPGSIVMNAPRPLLGTRTHEGEFVTGRFYAVIDADDTMAEKFIAENVKLDARLLVPMSKESQMDLVLFENDYREQYLQREPDERYSMLRGQLEKVRDLTFGELHSRACNAFGVVQEGKFAGPVVKIEAGVIWQRTNRGGDIAKHDMEKLNVMLQVGDVFDVTYKNGIGQVKVPSVEVGR